jgi:hypothetical protein
MLGDFPGRKRSEQIRPGTEHALLTVRGNLCPARSGTATVDAAGNRRRLQALQAIGYPARDLAQRLGAGHDVATAGRAAVQGPCVHRPRRR